MPTFGDSMKEEESRVLIQSADKIRMCLFKLQTCHNSYNEQSSKEDEVFLAHQLPAFFTLRAMAQAYVHTTKENGLTAAMQDTTEWV